jgi:hypothetical protein
MSSTTSTPTVFLSYSHRDQVVARRIVRELTERRVKTWLDERELRIGAALTASIRSQIEAADALLVVASHAAAASQWVGLEVDFAKQHDKNVIPIFIEPVAEHPRFRDHLGIDGTQPQSFADGVANLIRDLYSSVDREAPAADPTELTTDLRALAAEETNLAPLILGCLDGQGLHQESMETALGAPFHALDYAVNALYDLNQNENAAYHAAYAFKSAGAGTRALLSWIKSNGDGGVPLAVAVDATFQADLIPTAIRLMAACNPPNNQAVYGFIDSNGDRLDGTQRRAAIRLATWPIRTDTSRFGDVLGWVAMKRLPGVVELQRMWSRWISEGSFDGEPSSPRDLARYLADAHKEDLSGWEDINEALRRHMRRCLRSGDKGNIFTAMNHIKAAADEGAPVLVALLNEASSVEGTAEWVAWEKREPGAAEGAAVLLDEVRTEARGERNWLRAYKSAEQTMANLKAWRQEVEKREAEVGKQ